MSLPLLQIRDATKVYSSGGFLGTSQKSVVALDNFNMTIGGSPATITTIAGESGSGKTTLANLVLGFIRLTSGNIIFDGEDITDMTDEQLKDYRRNVQAVFQDPFGVYNPFYRIDHIFDLVNKHFSLSDNQSEYRDMVEAGLNVVGLYGEDVLRKYPHQLSGGQRQRIMMSRAYMIKPRLIVADEPVSMVDASLRASILDAMLRLRDDHNISFLYITHDLSTAYQIGDQIYMLYQGTTAERGTAMDVIDAPQHPYVQLLIDSVPVPDPTDKWDVNISLPSEEEMRTAASKGCRYYPRCPHRMDKCLIEQPPLYMMDRANHEAACYLYEENDIAPIEKPILYSKPKKGLAIPATGNSRLPRIAAVLALIVAVGVAFAVNQNNAAISAEATKAARDAKATSAAIAAATATAEAEASMAEATASAEAELADDSVAEAVVIPDFLLSADGATDKGALTLNVETVDEIKEADERHSYTFEATAGQDVTIRLVTGGSGLSGTGFYAPFGTVYGPDGQFALALGDNPNRPGRSHREKLTLAAGSYQIVIGANDEGIGAEGYTIVFQGEAPPLEPTAIPVVVPDFVLSADGATDKGELTLNVETVDEIKEADERHSYTFEATAGQDVTIRLVTGGSGLSGTGFYAPFGTVYGPDGQFVLALGDNPTRPGRSHREKLTLAAGSYQIVIGANDEGIGAEGYTIVLQGEAPPLEPTAIPVVVPDFVLSPDGATDKGALTLNVETVDEIKEETERHRYTFEATAGQDVTIRLVTGGSGLSGTGFYAPFGTVYGPDGRFALALGDNPTRPGRSHREKLTLAAGSYQIVIGANDEGIGSEGYTIVFEGADA